MSLALLSSSDLVAGVSHYGWAFLRLSALFVAAPVFSGRSMPVRIRIVLAVLITLLVAPLLPHGPQMSALGIEGLMLAIQQVLIGVAIGFLLQMAFAVAVIAGQAAAMAMGLGFAMSVDPQNGVQVPVLGQFYVILATLVFLGIDGHLLLIDCLVASFQILPIGAVVLSGQLALEIVLWASQMFVVALLVTLPTLTALLLINLAFGVITRAAPQLNIFAVGFPVTILAGFVFLLFTLPSVTTHFSQLFEASLYHAITLMEG